MAVIDNVDIRHSPIVTLLGEVDSSGCGHVTNVLGELLESGCESPKMDLAGVRFMDSAGLFEVLNWCRQFKDTRGGVEVVSINPLVKRLFEVAGCSDIINQSEERSVPPYHARQPITDCLAAAGGWEIRSFSVAGRLDSCKIVRDRIARTTALMQFTPEEKSDIKLAAGEAISNAIRYGCSEDPLERVSIRTLATPQKLIVEMTDNGPGFDPDNVTAISPATDLPEGGMGIKCMRQCMDEVTFDFSNGTTVRMTKIIRDIQAAQ